MPELLGDRELKSFLLLLSLYFADLIIQVNTKQQVQESKCESSDRQILSSTVVNNSGMV